VKSPKDIVIALMAAATLAFAALAWNQYQGLISLRAQLADGDNATLKKQLADARKTIKSLEDRLLAMRGRRGGGAGDAGGAEGEAGPDGPGGQGPGRRGGRFGAFAAMAANPEFQKLMAIQAKGRIQQTYAALFKTLNLSPDQLAQFQGMLADKQQALMDVMQAANAQGINPRTDPDGFKTLANQAIAQADASIQQALGDAAYATYQQYQQSLPERNTVNSLQTALSYSQTPLTDDEANQMISLLQQNQPQRAGSGTTGTSNGGDGGPGIMSLINGGGTAKVTDAALTQAQGVLSAPQISALQQIQQQQQAQQQMQQMMRAANQGSGAPSAAPPASTGGSG
jgi:chorismate mutase